MKVLIFEYSGRVGHFLRAEANASAPTYPVPPRTALLGLLGAILGMTKDEPQVLLKNAHIALSGKMPSTHWPRIKLRKDPPAPLPWVIKNKAIRENTTPEKATLIRQEWLWRPYFIVYASLPEPYHSEAYARLKERRWFFNPCMGLSEMMAEVALLTPGEYEAFPLPLGNHCVSTVVLQTAGQLNTETAFEQGLAIQYLRMPRALSDDRVFIHASYYIEKNGKPILFETAEAWQVGDSKIIFL